MMSAQMAGVSMQRLAAQTPKQRADAEIAFHRQQYLEGRITVEQFEAHVAARLGDLLEEGGAAFGD
jgi:hypothetical protein